MRAKVAKHKKTRRFWSSGMCGRPWMKRRVERVMTTLHVGKTGSDNVRDYYTITIINAHQ